ncbi:MAG: heme exporter protein CcmB [Saprospiraceae bacterium]|nr:heme exporter protein CcmB [Saprospiraceae bacterium]
MIKQLKALIYKDLLLDFRQLFGLGGVFLYVFASFFIVFLSFGEVEGQAWITLYWIVVLFGAVNAVLKSFTQEDEKRNIYYFLVTDPVAVMLSKLVYNSVLVLFIALLSLILFSLLTSYPIVTNGYFLLSLLLGSVGIAGNFTFVSAIANHTRNKNTMMMILSLPVIIPLLLPLIKVSIKCLAVVDWSVVKNDFTMLISVDLLILGISLILFPFLWRG